MALRESDIKTLRSAKFLAALKEKDLQSIAAHASVSTLEPGQALFHEGEPANAFYVVLEGWATLCRDHTNGERTVIHLVGPGESVC